MFLDESNDVAGFAAGPAAKILVALIDVKGGVVIVVEGTEALSCTPRASARRSMAITFRKMRFT